MNASRHAYPIVVSLWLLAATTAEAEVTTPGALPAAAPAVNVPAGFEVELVAGPPLVEHPTLGGFDPLGRLYLCDGPGLNMPAKELLEKLPNRIIRLEDTDGDGRFDRSRVFADKMTFPMGAVWHRGWLYVASPPHIWRLRDNNDDGTADEREIVVSEFGFTGNAADIHGCFLGPDGRIYWCDGRHGHNFVDEQGNQISKGLAARLFSCRPDGSDVEAFAGGGMDNPVEVTFTAEGEPLGTVAIFDIVDGRHDALVHWVYGGAYPRFEQKCVGEFKRTGELLPPVSRWLGVAPSGVTRYRGTSFGPDYVDNVFAVQFNTHTMVRSRLERDGATFRARDEDFLTSPSPDFHPTDVIEDADGSLLVVDTGGWFRIGCPTSRIAKPEILGGVYRVRKREVAPVADPRGIARKDWATLEANGLLALLSDVRPAVRDRAQAELALRGPAAVEALHRFRERSADAAPRGLAVWTLCQIDTPAARAAVRAALADQDRSVRQIAARAVGTLRDAEAFDELCELVMSDDPAIRRESATALGRIGQHEAVPVLLAALKSAGDRFLEHALIFALIQLNDRSSTLPGLADTNPQVRRAALVALDQMPAGNLQRDEVLPLLDTDDVVLQRAVLEVIEKHAGWAGETSRLLAGWLTESSPTAERVAMVRGALLAFCGDATTQKLVSETLAAATTRPATRTLLLEVMARCDLGELPAGWSEQLGRCLTDPDPAVAGQAVATIAARRDKSFDEALRALARATPTPAELRLAAWTVLARNGSALETGAFDLLALRLGEQTPPLERLAAAEALGLATLTAEQQARLLEVIARAGPLELPVLVRAFEKALDAGLGTKLVAALEKAPGLESLTAERVRQVFAAYPAEVQAASAALVKRLGVDLAAQRARLDELTPLLDGGDPARGKLVFQGKKSSCAACHRAQNEGGLVGPDLTKVGQIRSRMDLLESLVFPSSSFARGYESYSVVTDEGQVFTGILSRETADAVYLKTAQREELRVPRKAIEQMAPSKLSIMPQGFDKLLSADELRDVLAYLQSLR